MPHVMLVRQQISLIKDIKMERIFRNGGIYAAVEHAKYLGYICIHGKEVYVVKRWRVDNVLECQRTLEKLTGKGGWKWIA